MKRPEATCRYRILSWRSLANVSKRSTYLSALQVCQNYVACKCLTIAWPRPTKVSELSAERSNCLSVSQVITSVSKCLTSSSELSLASFSHTFLYYSHCPSSPRSRGRSSTRTPTLRPLIYWRRCWRLIRIGEFALRKPWPIHTLNNTTIQPTSPWLKSRSSSRWSSTTCPRRPWSSSSTTKRETSGT